MMRLPPRSLSNTYPTPTRIGRHNAGLRSKTLYAPPTPSHRHSRTIYTRSGLDRHPEHAIPSSRRYHGTSPAAGNGLSPVTQRNTNSPDPPPIVKLSNALLVPFNLTSHDKNTSPFPPITWTISSSPSTESWAVIGPSGQGGGREGAGNLKTLLVEAGVRGYGRVLNLFESEEAGGKGGGGSRKWPLYEGMIERHFSDTSSEKKIQGASSPPTLESYISLVSFRTSLSSPSGGGAGGGFTDYTARYYALREKEDKTTLREHLLSEFVSSPSSDTSAITASPSPAPGTREVEEISKLLNLDKLLDVPLVGLSNGQTRRARIARALVKGKVGYEIHNKEGKEDEVDKRKGDGEKLQMLILDEPFTGLDTNNRSHLASILYELHLSSSPRILLILREQDEIPDWITHLVWVSKKADGSGQVGVNIGRKDDVVKEVTGLIGSGSTEKRERFARAGGRAENEGGKNVRKGEELIRLRKVNVSYGPRHVLKDIDWTIREGENWLLKGHNGSGKSTLLSLILGDHPRSYNQDVQLFGKARVDQSTFNSHVSPELFHAFPRKTGEGSLSALEAISTGYDSIFSFRPISSERRSGILDLAHEFGVPELIGSGQGETNLEEFLSNPFASFSPGFQSLFLLMRALIKSPRLLIIDEPFAGMDSKMVRLSRRYLDGRRRRDDRQAMVVVSHYEEEIPDCVDQVLELEDGMVVRRG